MTATWIAIAYDSAHEYALGDSAEAAQENYRDQLGEPELGFISTIITREDFDKEYKRAADTLGLDGVPVFMASLWVIVAQITPEGVAALEGKTSPSRLLCQGFVPTSDGKGEVFTLEAKRTVFKERHEERTRAGETIMEQRKRRKAERQNIQPINGIAPSERQREYAQNDGVNWLDVMAWAHNKGEITLTAAEIEYARARYGDAADKIHVNKAYRVAQATN